MNEEAKVACAYYEPDYERIVKELKEVFKDREQDLRGELKKELNPLKYLELNAKLNEVTYFYNCLLEFKEHFTKPVEVKQNDYSTGMGNNKGWRMA